MLEDSVSGLNASSIKKVELYFNRTLSGVSKLSFDRYLNDTFSLRRAEEEANLLISKIRMDVRGRRLLEIGSGFGLFVANSIINHGAESYGVESDEVCCEISKEILSSSGLSADIITKGRGESLPYQDGLFDIIYSSNVLEHVEDPEKVFSEAFRVLKPGGYIFFIIPNYGSWWEGHYGILWLPHMPRSIARLYVKLLGRDPRYIDELQLVSLRKVRYITQKFRGQLDILDWGWDIWERRLKTLDFSGWASLHELKRYLDIVNRLRLSRTVIFLGKRLEWLTPILLLGRKRTDV